MEKCIVTSVDELTLVLSPDKAKARDIAGWGKLAGQIIAEFNALADLEGVFGKQEKMDGKIPQGYSTAYRYGDNPFYFAAAYHPDHPAMGVIIKFSAYSWRVYCERRGTDVKGFLLSVKSDLYKSRLSRIDFAVDYMDWDMSVNGIYQRPIGGQLEIHNYKAGCSHSRITSYEENGVADTFYVGSRKSGTRLFLRVYDKKKEQTEQKGHRLEEALRAESWVRFEAVFKGRYAHQLTDFIMAADGGELPGLIADKVAEKYRFYDLENKQYTDFTAALMEKPGASFQRLHLTSPRDNGLTSSLAHLVNGSGLFTILYKCDGIWGDGASKTLLEYLYGHYKKEYQPNDDALLWLKKHKNEMGKQTLEDELELLEDFLAGKTGKGKTDE